MFHNGKRLLFPRFYPSLDRKKISGEIPIYVRITVNRQKVELSTRQVIKDTEDWDDQSERVKQKSNVNNALNEIEVELRNAYQEIKFTKKPLSPQAVRDLYLGKGKEDRNLLAFLESYYREKVLANKELSEGTIKNYRSTLNHLINYLDSAQLKRIGLREVNLKFIERFDKFLMSTPAVKSSETLKRNTANKYHTKLKAMLSVAVRDELLDRNPYMNFKLKGEATTRTFLTRPEWDRLESHPLNDSPSLIKVRDVFIFSVYTGLRFNDAINLKKKYRIGRE